MLAVSLPGLAYSGNAVSLHQSAPDQVVLGNLSDCLGQGWNFRRASFQTDCRVLDHRQPDAAQDTHCDGTPGSIYRLHDLVEIDDALVGGRRSGKRGRGAEGKSAVLVAVENRDTRAGFIAMQQVPAVTKETVAKFVQGHLPPNQLVRSDALASLAEIGKTQHHAARVTPPGKAGVWLPWVHVAIGNLKAFLLGTYHGVSAKYLQEYLNEFCYRFNRREWEAKLPLRLLNACLTHTQVKLKMV